MDFFTELLDVFTLIVSFCWLITNFKYIIIKPRYIVLLFFFIFYVFPLALDYTMGLPEYDGINYYGFDLTSKDNNIRIVYDVMLLAMQWLLLYFFKDNRFYKYEYSSNIELKRIWLYSGMLIAPIITIVLDKNLIILYTFQWREYGLFSIPDYFYLSEPCTYIGVSTALYLLAFQKEKKSLDTVITLVLLYFNICLEGKRAIMMFLLVNISIILFLKYINWKKNNYKSLSILKGGSIIVVVGLFVLYMVSVSTMVMTNRGFDASDKKKMQMLTRVDFLRDDRIRMAVYSEIHPDKMKILDNKCQTLYYDLIYTFPINFFVHDKNAGSYQEHFSSALRNDTFSKDNNYMTTSIWAECISNFGIIVGFIFMFALSLWIARLVESYKQLSISAMLLSTYVLINMFTFAYVIMYIEFIFILCLYARNKRPSIAK